MQVTLLHPLSLLLLAVVPALWFWPRRLNDWRHGVIRSLLFVLLTLALAQPVWVRPAAETCHVIIMDRSASLSAGQRSTGEALLNRLQKQVSPRDRLTVVEFGGDALASRRDDDEPRINRQDIRLVDSSSSSFAAALTAGLRGIPRGCQGAVTLIGDGLATDRRWGRPVQELLERGIVVAVHDLAQRGRDVYPARIVTPPWLRVGSTARVEVELVGVASGVQVKLGDAQGELTRSNALDSNGHLSVTLEFEPRAAGYAELTAEVIVPPGQDDDATNNTRSTTIAVQDALRLLYLGERQHGGARRLAQLLGNGFDVEEPGAPLDERFPLDRYDLVMLDDRPAESLPAVFQQRLLAKVQHDGLGIFFSGGRAAFGAGGYAKSMLAAALPVNLVQREEQRDPSVALAIILDSSGSMAGLQLELGKQVARLATRRLQPHDEIGIVEFYGAKSWAVPLQSARNRLEVDRAIGRIQADGSTVLYPAIEEAYYGLKKSQARYKHIVMITDAGVEDAGFEKLIRRIAADGVAVSTVLVGQAYSPLLADMARWGGGKYYSVTDKFSLVDLDFREPSSERLPAYRQGMFGVKSQGGTGWWGTAGSLQPPPLRGYAETKRRKEAEVLLETQSASHPVLSSWHYGLGRVTAFMSEPVGEGTANWRQWPEYGAMLGRVLARTASDYEPFGFELARDDYEITLRARRYSPEGSLRPRAVSIEDAPRELQFRQVAADLFEAVDIIDPRKELRVLASIAGAGDGGFSRRLVSPALEDVSPETQVDPRRSLNLQALAGVSGGGLIDKDAPRLPAVSKRQAGSFSLAQLSPWILLLGLLTYLGELCYRRNKR
jgi:hypothetical protein